MGQLNRWLWNHRRLLLRLLHRPRIIAAEQATYSTMRGRAVYLSKTMQGSMKSSSPINNLAQLSRSRTHIQGAPIDIEHAW